MYNQPSKITELQEQAREVNFTMSCDPETGALLRTLAASKPAGSFLELGTGAGVSTLWIADGMDPNSSLISVEMDEELHRITKSVIHDERVEWVTMDGGEFIEIEKAKGRKFDLIFADTWPGKYYFLEETLSMVKPGGLYIIDDLTPVDTWPEEHEEKARKLIETLVQHPDFQTVQLNWSTGILIATKK